jgi:RecB family exonuclease
MPLHLVRTSSNRVLWHACADRFLTEAAASQVTRHHAHIWLTHRLHRDLLLEAAAKQKLRGWLKPPVQFFSALPQLFGISGKPIGLLTRRELIGRLALEQGTRAGIGSTSLEVSLARGHMLDGFFGELLPEGITPDGLQNQLARVEQDEFAARRNAWVVATYRAYLDELTQAELFDPRAIHALIARQISNGKLVEVLDGARRLHIYGLHSLRARGVLLRALAQLNDVEVVVYTTSAAQEFDAIATSVEELPHSTPTIFVQPAPDAQREAQWVAARVKELLLEQKSEAHEIAVVARTGLEDTRRMVQALESAGVPATARIRTPLAEISALKAVLDLFRAAADSWSYRALRTVLASPYLGVRLDLRPFDRVACDARPASLDEWHQSLTRLLAAVEAEQDSDAKRMGIHADRLQGVINRFNSIRENLARLDADKPLSEWIAIARDLLADRGFRQRVSRAPLDRYDVVRLDQRGVRQVQRLLDEWARLERGDDVLSPGEWYQILRSLLEGNELVMTTPGQKGVQVLEAHDAPLVPFKATFVIHANDGAFPRVAATNGLFTEEERRLLAQHGLPVEYREKSLERERVLWHAVTGNDDVAISYRTTDPRGTPLLPSLLVPPHERDSELPRSEVVPAKPLNPDHEQRIAAAQVARAIREGAQPSRIAVAHPHALRQAILMAHAERMRGAPERDRLENPYHPWNGVLRDPFVLQRLQDRFNAEYAWSPSQLQKYAACPFFFLVDRVLGLQEVEEAEEDTSPMTVGGVAHDILEAFYRETMNAVPLSLDDSAQRTLRTVAERVFAEREAEQEWLGSPVLWRHRKRDILDTLTAYLQWELSYLTDKGEQPVDCELVLGGEDRYMTVVGHDVKGERVEMRVAGRIDRIDVDRRGQQHVLDYKTKTIPPTKGYDDGATLQAPVYMKALLTMGRPVSMGRYRKLESPGDPQNGCKVVVNNEDYNSALTIAFSIPERVRRGLFEVHLAASLGKWPWYELDLSVRRTDAVIEAGDRYND